MSARLRNKVTLVFVFLVLSVVPERLRAQEDWKAKWDRVVEAARKEGQVSIISTPGALLRNALVAPFQKAYPGIEVNYTTLNPRDAIPRMIRERGTNLYLWDLLIGGPTSSLVSLKPAGVLAPLREALLLPEVLDNSKWREGFEGGFNDFEKRLSYSFNRDVSLAIYVNRDLVSPGEFDSPTDLLNPKFAGKITSDDPRVEGSGLGGLHVLYRGEGEEFSRNLLTKQKVVYHRDRRQLAEWVVKGQHPIGIGILPTDLEYFQQRGAGKNVVTLEDSKFRVVNLSVGFGAVALIDQAPHPNAAKVYLNWLLSRDGQQAWNRITGRNSRRTDVTPGQPSLMPKPDAHYLRNPGESPKPGVINYLITATEVLIPEREHVRKLAEQLIAK